jgi:hypothetical protein
MRALVSEGPEAGSEHREIAVLQQSGTGSGGRWQAHDYRVPGRYELAPT